jgi:hypothetical protein
VESLELHEGVTHHEHVQYGYTKIMDRNAINNLQHISSEFPSMSSGNCVIHPTPNAVIHPIKPPHQASPTIQIIP